MRRENKKLLTEMSHSPKPVANVNPAAADKTDYLEQLRMAQTSLRDHNEKINQLLGNIDTLQEKEEQQRELLKANYRTRKKRSIVSRKKKCLRKR